MGRLPSALPGDAGGLSAHCEKGTATVASCGGASVDFEAPALTLEAARGELGIGNGVTERCRQVAQRLPGRWEVSKRSVDRANAPVYVFGLEISQVTGCDLTGRVVPPKGAPLPIRGWIDAKSGVWRLQPTGPPNRPIWALAGWDPAFGAADRGASSLVAQKRASPARGR